MKKLFIASALFLAAIGKAQTQYHLTDLGTLGGEVQYGISSSATGLNSMGQVAGGAYTTSGVYHAFIYSNGVMTDIGVPSSAYRSSGFASINDAGMMVGTCVPNQGDYHAFSYSGGTWQDLGDLKGGGGYSHGFGSNDNGQIVGWTEQTGSGSEQAFSFWNGGMQALGTLGGNGAEATAINAPGQIVGDSATSGGVEHAFIFSNGIMQDLGSLGDDSFARAINDSGQIVGSFDVSNSAAERPFLYQNGVMQDLGILGGDPAGARAHAWGINNLGQIVGDSSNGSGPLHGFIYENGAMVDLNYLLDSSGTGYFVTNGYSINDSGLIVGLALVPGQTYSHAVLLTPLAPNYVPPSGFTPIVGNRTGGSLYCVQFNDPWYLTVQPGVTTQLSQAPVQLQFSGTSPTHTPTSLQFTFSGHVNSINLSQSLQLWNYNTNAYETFSTTAAHVGSDATVTVTATGDLRRYVNQSTGALSAKVNFSRAGATSVIRWTASLGVANWIIH